MDILNSLSRWVLGKRGEMHQLFEQCSQGYPRKEPSVFGAAKRLTHTSTEGGVLNMLKRLPMGMGMTMGSVTSDKYPYQSQMDPMDGMNFPVVGPKDVPDMSHLPPYSQCLGGNPGSVTVSSAKTNINQQQHLKQPSFSQTDPGKHHDTFQYTDSKHIKFQENHPKSGHFQEIAKSSMWKHIFAPPFTPASAKNKYPYSMADPAPGAAERSHLYPYAHRNDPVTETMHMRAACGYPSASYNPGAPCFASQLGTLGSGCHPFSQIANYSFAPPYVPCYIFGQPSPMQVHQCQHILISHPTSSAVRQQYQKPSQVNTHRPCRTSSHRPAATQCTQTVKQNTQSPVKASRQDDPPALSEVVNGIQSLQVSAVAEKPKADPTPAIAPVASPPQSVPSPDTAAPQSTKMELNCDNQQKADTAEVDSTESAISDRKDNSNCAQADSSITEHKPQMENCQESHTPKSQPHKASSKDSNVLRHPCITTPNTNPRKKRKCRPSAEKRRRRRMSAVCTVSAKPSATSPDSDSANSSKKLKTDHVSSSEELGRKTMNATVAFILGLDSEDEAEEIDNTKATLRSNSAKSSHVKSFCFSISSCSDSDSDFDDVSGGSDTTDGIMDELTWGGLNFSLDPFKFPCLSSTPIPSTPIPIKKTMSSPQLMSFSGDSERDPKHPLSLSPTRRTSLGKHVKFASEDLLVTIHTIEDELDAYQEARKGDWEQFARDRCRFKDRTNDIEREISWVFDPDHRARVQRRLQSYSESISSQ